MQFSNYIEFNVENLENRLRHSKADLKFRSPHKQNDSPSMLADSYYFFFTMYLFKVRLLKFLNKLKSHVLKKLTIVLPHKEL